MANAARIDLGEKLPLRSRTRYLAEHTVFCAMGATILFVVPMAYGASEGFADFSSWWMLVIVGAGFFLLVLTVATLFNRVSFVIDRDTARVELRRLFRRTTTSSAPLAEYAALVASSHDEEGFPRTRPVYQITLWHGGHSAKQVCIFLHHKRELYEKRLKAYTELFALPVNPEGLDLINLDTAAQLLRAMRLVERYEAAKK